MQFRKIFRGVPVVLLCFFGPATGAAMDSPVCQDWDGLWRVASVNEGEVPLLHFLLFAKGGKCNARFFSQDFTSASPGTVRFEGEALRLDSLPVAKAFTLLLNRKADEVEGSQSFLHPQYKASFPRTGYRVFKDSGWDPVSKVKSKADELGMVSFLKLVGEKGPDLSPEEFRKLWAQELEPVLYPFTQDVVYGQRAGIADRNVAVDKIGAMLRDPSFVEKARKFETTHAQVVARIKKDAPDLFYPNLFLDLPALGKFDATYHSHEKGFLVRLGMDSIIAKSKDPVPWLAKEHLKLPLFSMFAPVDSSLVARICREGIPAYWAVSRGFAKNPLECLLPPPEGIEKIPAEITPELKRKILLAVKDPLVAKMVTDTEVLTVGYGFARQLSAVLSVPEILNLNRGTISERLWSYLQPPPPPPAASSNQGKTTR